MLQHCMYKHCTQTKKECESRSRIDCTLRQVGGRQVELWPTSVQESRRRAQISIRVFAWNLGHRRLRWCWSRPHNKWKGDKLAHIIPSWGKREVGGGKLEVRWWKRGLCGIGRHHWSHLWGTVRVPQKEGSGRWRGRRVARRWHQCHKSIRFGLIIKLHWHFGLVWIFKTTLLEPVPGPLLSVPLPQLSGPVPVPMPPPPTHTHLDQWVLFNQTFAQLTPIRFIFQLNHVHIFQPTLMLGLLILGLRAVFRLPRVFVRVYL